MKAVGHFIFGAIRDIRVSVDLRVAQGNLVADRTSSNGVRRDNSKPITWVENPIYRVEGGHIAELWPAGGPDVS
jgi:hypothetical protein